MNNITASQKRTIEHGILIAEAALLITWVFTGSDFALNLFTGWFVIINFSSIIAIIGIKKGLAANPRKMNATDFMAWIVWWTAAIFILALNQKYMVAGLVTTCMLMQSYVYYHLSKPE